MAINKDKYLNDILESYSLNRDEKLKEKFVKKKNELKENLEKEFGSKMYNCRDSGSYAKHTANNDKLDMDTVAPFKYDSFDTLEKMFDAVYDFLKKTYEDTGLAKVRKQKVSVGIIFNVDADGDVVKLDVVAGRELSQDQYDKDKNLNIYVNGLYGELSSYLQTNIDKQIDHIKGKDRERNSIRLLKVYRNSQGFDLYKSYMLELLTIKAFANGIDENGVWEQLKKAFEYIRDNITKITLVDVGNSNNDVVKTLTADERQQFSNRASTFLKNIEANDEWLKTYFPANAKFPIDEEGYKEKEKKPTILPPTNSFG